MKTIKNYFLLGLLTICMGLSFTACGDDDDDANFETSDLVGVWDLVAYQGWEKENGVIEDQWNDTELSEESRLEFQSDGTFIEYEYYGTWTEVNRGKWSLSGNKIVVKFAYDEIGYSVIKSLTANTLVTEYYDVDREDGDTYEEYELCTYNRVR